MCLNCGTPAQNNADDKRLHLHKTAQGWLEDVKNVLRVLTWSM